MALTTICEQKMLTKFKRASLFTPVGSLEEQDIAAKLHSNATRVSNSHSPYISEFTPIQSTCIQR